MSVPLAAAALAADPFRPAAYAAASTAARVPPDPASVEPAAAAVRSFTADVYRALAPSRQGGNLVCSPYSVAHALAMTRAGARGCTAREMDAVLHAPSPRPRALDAGLNTIDQDVLGPYRDGDGSKVPKVTTANALWTQRDLAVQAAFQDTLAGYYGAGAYPVDFRDAPEAAREEINIWVAGRTADKIPELLPSGTVSADTNLILTNTTYLKAAWVFPFRPAFTAAAPFTRDDGTVVDVQMMSGPFDPMGYQEGDGWRAVRIPLEGGTLAMSVVMPTLGTLADVEARLDGAWLATLLQGFQRAEVQLRLPKWTFRLPVKMGGVLSGLGMPTAFTDRADLSGMVANQALKIDDVVHETFVGVDEKGVEAAAATAVIIRPPSIPQGPQFFANRPFLYVLHEALTGLPLFIGRVHDPLVETA